MKPVVHVMHTWNFAYRAARKGPWETFVRDRERFKIRIQRTAVILDPILSREHRQRIFESRFEGILLKQQQEKMECEDKKLHQQGPEQRKGKRRRKKQQQCDESKEMELNLPTTNLKLGNVVGTLRQNGPKICFRAICKQKGTSADDLIDPPATIKQHGGRGSMANANNRQGTCPLKPPGFNMGRMRPRPRAVIYYLNTF